MSNLHIYVLGASFFPLESVRMFNELEVGTKAFIYNKSTSGPISDTSADATSRWVGWEWDIYADWRITSDLAWTIRYGFFQPGSAFSDRQCRQFRTALTLSSNECNDKPHTVMCRRRDSDVHRRLRSSIPNRQPRATFEASRNISTGSSTVNENDAMRGLLMLSKGRTRAKPSNRGSSSSKR